MLSSTFTLPVNFAVPVYAFRGAWAWLRWWQDEAAAFGRRDLAAGAVKIITAKSLPAQGSSVRPHTHRDPVGRFRCGANHHW
jgi:hypothetical protein